MDEVLVYFDEWIDAPDGAHYDARACTCEQDDGRWSGWLEFSRDGGDWRATEVETTQPNRRDVEYWVTGLSRVYLQGALMRAIEARPAQVSARRGIEDVASSSPVGARTRTPAISSSGPRTILDPFSVFAQGEGVLRAQLAALNVDQVKNIAAAFNIESPETASTLDAHDLRERIVGAARRRASQPMNPELRA